MNRFHRIPRKSIFVTAFATALVLVACSSPSQHPSAPGAVSADELELVKGIPDRGAHTAVVAIDIGDNALCSGALIAPDIVLTARHCVSVTADRVTCPSHGTPQVQRDLPASSLKILVGDDIATATLAAQGVKIFVPPGDALCDADVALILLNHEIAGIQPFDVRATGIAKGDHVSAVGFGRVQDGGPAGTKLVRDHVKVLDISEHEFLVGEATCQGDSGGPALDEQSAQIVGVVSRGGPSCDGKTAHNVYTRTDAFLPLIDEALTSARSAPPIGPPTPLDAGRRKAHKDGGTKGGRKPHSDLGAACKTASDCAAGVCVTDGAKQYCSRACDPADRCPSHFRCTKTPDEKTVCLEH